MGALHTEGAGPIRPDMPASVRRTVRFVDQHGHESISVGDMADAAHLSVRGLQALLRRHLDLTPLELLRRTRLARVRDDLEHAGPGDTVGAIASVRGFAHLGRFAADYRATYGEKPSATLRRATA